jgi:hypothetical protein
MFTRFNRLSTALKLILTGTAVGSIILFVIVSILQTGIGEITTPIFNALGDRLSAIRDYTFVLWIILAFLVCLTIFLAYKLV